MWVTQPIHILWTFLGPCCAVTVLVCFCDWLMAADWCLTRTCNMGAMDARTADLPGPSYLPFIAHQVPACAYFVHLQSAWSIWKLLDSLYRRLGALPQRIHWTTFFTCASAVCRTMPDMGKGAPSSDNTCRMCHRPDFRCFRAPHPAWLFVQSLHYVQCQWLQVRP